MHDFQGYFSRTFQDIKLQFPGLSRSWNFQEKIQDFPGSVGTLTNTKLWTVIVRWFGGLSEAAASAASTNSVAILSRRSFDLLPALLLSRPAAVGQPAGRRVTDDDVLMSCGGGLRSLSSSSESVSISTDRGITPPPVEPPLLLDGTISVTDGQSAPRVKIVALNNSNSNSHDSVYGAVIVAVHYHCESSPGASDECSTQRQMVTDLWTKPISRSQYISL